MKKSISIIIAVLLMAALLVGCGQTTAAQTGGDTATQTTPELTPDTFTEAAETKVEAEAYNYSAGLDENGFFEGVKASDIVTLPQYSGVSLSGDVRVAAPEAVQEQIDGIMANFSDYEQITDRAAADGDTLNIDYVGKIDGVEFEGGSTQGMGDVVTIGVTSYIDTFIEQLIGHTPGETFDVNVTFPAEYPNNPDLAGKPAVFTVTINYIQGEYQQAELTDEIAATYGFTTVDLLKADIEQWIIEQQRNNAFQAIAGDAVCENIPQSVLDYVVNADIAYYEEYAAMYGVDIDTFFATYMDYETKQAYIDANADTYNSRAITMLAVQAIAELENITVSDDDVNSSEYASYVTNYGKPYLKMYLLQNELVPSFVVDNAKFE